MSAMRGRRSSVARAVAACACAWLAAVPSPARAQAWARWAVPDSQLVATVQGGAGTFENTWNALLVAELRATLAKADSAGRLVVLARRVADAEPEALGTRIASEALTLRVRWMPAEMRVRVRAAVAESLGQVAQRAGDATAADARYVEALEGYRTVRERRREAWVLGSRQVTAFAAREYHRADSLGRLSLAARRSIGDLKMVGNSLYDLGNIAFELHRPADAERYHREAVEVRTRTGEISRRGAALRGVADAVLAQGRAAEALALYPQALELTVAGGDSGRTLEVLTSYGVAQLDHGDPARAVALLERARAITQLAGAAALEAGVLVNLAQAERQGGAFTAAVAHLDEAVALAAAAGDDGRRAIALVTLGQAWLGVRDPQQARVSLTAAVALADSLGDARLAAQALNNLSLAAWYEGDLRTGGRLAARARTRALEAGDPELEHDVLLTLGTIAFERGLPDSAGLWFRAAAERNGALGAELRAADAINLGNVASVTGRYDEAAAHYQAALALADSANAPDPRWMAWLGLGDVAERRGRHAEALAWDRRAAALIDTLRVRQRSEGAGIAAFGRRLFAYEALVHLLSRLDAQYPDSGYAAEAFQWAERARARAFLDRLAARRGDASLAKPITLSEAQARVGSSKTALLAYSTGDSSTSLWVVGSKRWRHVVLPARRALKARAEILRRALGDPEAAESEAAREAARALYRTLIEPVEADLKGVERLLILPDGPLALIPFEALLTRDVPAGSGVPKGAWLVERWRVAYAPSASALAALGGEKPQPAILALGDPDFGRGTGDPRAGAAGLPRLPNTAAEVVALGMLAPPRAFTTLTGRDATRERLLTAPGLATAEVLHIATHGVADEGDPSRSGLWLAAPDTASPSGFLSVADLDTLDLRARLVTLSACETGLGRLERGEGVLGLARGFLGAGAQSVIVSQWRVNDASSAMLMQAFYDALLKQRGARDAALATAKRRLIANPATRSPFHWAPFVLIGGSGKLGD